MAAESVGTAIYVVLVTIVVFLYVRLRKVEARIEILDASFDALFQEVASADTVAEHGKVLVQHRDAVASMHTRIGQVEEQLDVTMRETCTADTGPTDSQTHVAKANAEVSEPAVSMTKTPEAEPEAPEAEPEAPEAEPEAPEVEAPEAKPEAPEAEAPEAKPEAPEAPEVGATENSKESVDDTDDLVTIDTNGRDRSEESDQFEKLSDEEPLP